MEHRFEKLQCRREGWMFRLQIPHGVTSYVMGIFEIVS